MPRAGSVRSCSPAMRPGTAIRLEYEGERRDHYGRTLAALFLPCGACASAEIARVGLAIHRDYGRQRFSPPRGREGPQTCGGFVGGPASRSLEIHETTQVSR